MASVLLEARPYRPFKSSEEYLYAMREDLAEWLNTLYPELLINVDNFMDRLDTGIALCKVRRILIDFCIVCLPRLLHPSRRTVRDGKDKLRSASFCNEDKLKDSRKSFKKLVKSLRT